MTYTNWSRASNETHSAVRTASVTVGGEIVPIQYNEKNKRSRT